MELFVYVLTDLVHFLTILMTCYMFFDFRGRQVKHKTLMLLLVSFVIAITSIGIYYSDNYIVETIIYFLLIVSQIYILYKERLFRVILVAVGIVFALSMLDTMTTVLMEIIMELLKIKCDTVSKLFASCISLLLVILIGRTYKKNVSTGLNSIGLINLAGFTMLLIMDTLVVAIIKTQPITELYAEDKRTLYLIAVVFVIIGIFIQLAAVIIFFTQRNVYKEKEEITDRYLNEQKSHYEYLENREKETKKFRHDLRSHMEMISNLAKNHEYDKIDDYLEKMHFKIEKFGNIVTVQNGIVDAIINQYYEKAMQNGVTMEVKGRFPMDCTIDAYDLCTIFSNVLSNSLEAAIETEEKYISLECGYTDKSIIIVVKNSFNAEIQNGNRQWRSRKPDADYHGYGLENIKESVNKYSGVFDIETEGNIFCVKILFSSIGK